MGRKAPAKTQTQWVRVAPTALVARRGGRAKQTYLMSFQ